ncbi:MAG: DUF3071 domain-containing protein, partial [Actinomyces sp.]|nr:DUF3071 domain-containing protein [Actinomyces sp.]
MIELELLGTGADGQSLVMTDAEGERYSVPITDELRGAVRRDRPRLESVTTPQQRPLRPREIQALLRSGLTAEELARESSMDIAHIRRFEAPVAAEKEWMLTRALDSHVGGDRDAPVMGDLVVDRLAARGVDPASLVWSARRADEGPWEIALTFLQGAAEHAAHWRMAPSATAVEAVDQEARWLTETAAPSPVSAVFTPLPARPEHPVDEGDADLRARDALLDQLNAARGHRESIDIPLEEDLEDSLDEEDTEESRTGRPTGSLSARIYSLAHARTRPAPPAPHGSDSPTVTSGGAPAAEGAGRGDGDQSDIGGTSGPGTPPAPTARASVLPQ